jgi:hypothetical protein
VSTGNYILRDRTVDDKSSLFAGIGFPAYGLERVICAHCYCYFPLQTTSLKCGTLYIKKFTNGKLLQRLLKWLQLLNLFLV